MEIARQIDVANGSVTAREEETDRLSSIGKLDRVVLVTPRFFPYMGGVENHVYQVSQRLAQKGIDTTILTTDITGQLPASENLDGITIRRVRAWPSKQDYYFAPGIFRIITQEPWHIVHVQSYHTFVAPIAMFAALRANIPYVVTFHGGGHSSRLRHGLRRVQHWLLRPMFARAERLVAIAEFEVSLFGKRLGIPQEKFVFIPNGGDLPDVSDEIPGLMDEDLIVSIGRLERYKGHHRVIAAMPEILAQRPGARLWIAGAGPYESELWNLVRRLGIAHRVEIYAIPATDRRRMARELSKAALVVVLSEYETHPIAVLEAVALGRSVIVADTSGLSELAQKGLARAIPLRSTPEQVAREVLEQLLRPHKPPAIEFPTWDECAMKLLSLYSEISRRNLCGS